MPGILRQQIATYDLQNDKQSMVATCTLHIPRRRFALSECTTPTLELQTDI